MRSRPWPIIILALLHILAPFLNAGFSASLEGLSIPGYLNVLIHETSWLGLVDFFVLFPLAGIAIYLCKRWSYFVVLLVAALNVVSNFQTWKTYPAYFPAWLFVVAVILGAVLVGYFLLPAVKIVYMDPRLRWWESKPRYLIAGECVFTLADHEVRARVTDFSEGGVFVGAAAELPLGAVVPLVLSLSDHTLRLSGKIVYRRQGEVPGFGIQFTSPSSSARKEIRTLLRELKRRGTPVRTPFDWKEDLRAWFSMLVRTGEGIVPKVPR
ncbi:MAG: hypothetical protein A2X94_15280 [Bdellovibrionales bacterium GWB1_55_8]|nr:MAG: hypothetical protein A2X94_15280 [Bdellovibrionales bacterium GWB1_55_8]